MSGRRTSSRLKIMTRSSSKSSEKSPPKPTPYSRNGRKCASKDPNGQVHNRPADAEHPNDTSKTSNSTKGNPSSKKSPAGPPNQPNIAPGRCELVEVIGNTQGCRSGSLVTMDVLVITHEDATVILTTDRDSSSVNALFRDGSEERTSSLPLSHCLTNFTVIEDNLVAAGVWCLAKMIVFKVFPDLDLQRTIETRTRYSCIAFLSPGTLVGSYVNKGGVDIFDMSGNVLRKFDVIHIDEPYSVCTYNGNCIVGDTKKRAIMSFNDMGNMQFKYKPRGEKKFVGLLTVMAHGGYIYAADRKGNRVVQLTVAGKFVRDVLTVEDGIEEPQGICITDDNLLYVSVIYSYIKVFRIG
ncbi:uncharacterized protein [Haliotis cracherodii]|uniref:uncharacterized protein n=1 Tax=Haliotis cracherodii TaxID=6455 RepID=UPI0039EBEEEB